MVEASLDSLITPNTVFQAVALLAAKGAGRESSDAPAEPMGDSWAECCSAINHHQARCDFKGEQWQSAEANPLLQKGVQTTLQAFAMSA